MLGITVRELHSLDYEEYYGWHEYFRRRPYGWREDLRSYYVMSSMAGGKTKPEEIFPSIRQLKEQEEVNRDDAKDAARSFKASPFAALLTKNMKVEGLDG